MLEKEKSTYVCLLLSNRYLCTVRIHRIHRLGANNCSLSLISPPIIFLFLASLGSLRPNRRLKAIALPSFLCTFALFAKLANARHHIIIVPHTSPYFSFYPASAATTTTTKTTTGGQCRVAVPLTHTVVVERGGGGGGSSIAYSHHANVYIHTI